MTSWTKDLDDAIILATSSGRYHVLLFCMLCALASIPTSFLAFSQVFTTATPEHWCSPPPGLSDLNVTLEQGWRLVSPPTPSGKPDSCLMYDLNVQLLQEMYEHTTASGGDLENLIADVQNTTWSIVPCQFGWTFDTTYYDRTLVTEMSLVCERGWWGRSSNTLFWVGSLLGNLIFGWLSDRWGRRKTILLMVYLEVPLSIATCFSGDIVQFTALRVLGGLFFPALYQIPFILALELMPPNMRTYTGMVIGMMFASGMCILALLAFLLRDWFALSLATSVPFLVLYSCYWLVPESPRWRVGRGRVGEAEEVLRKMAKANGVHLQRGFLFRLHKEEKERQKLDVDNLGGIQIKNNLYSSMEDLKDNHQQRKSNNQAFNLDQNVRTNNEKSTDMEKMLSFEVTEIVKKKSRLKSDDTPKEEASLILDINKNDEIQIIDDEMEIESQNTKRTQTNNFELRANKKPVKFINKILGNHKDEGIESKLEVNRIDQDSLEGDKEASPLDVLRYPNIRKKFFILTFDWIANAVVYNGLSYNSCNLGVNDYLAFFIGGVVELPSYLIAWKSMDRFGRRWVLCVTMFIGGLACISSVMASEESPWTTVALAMVGRLCVAASFAVFYVFVGELLPTVLRAQAMGAASFLSGLALLACPYIVHLAVYSRVLPLAIMGTLSVAGAVASVFLPETLHQPLPQTTQDGENFGKHFRIFSCPARPEE